MKIDLTGKVALVTASTGGIGFAIARGLAESGAEVIVNGRSVDSVNKGIQALQQVVPGVQVRAAIADLSSQEGVDELLRVATHVDILVNNAGTIRREDALAFTEKDWDEVIDLNLKSVFFLSQAVAKQFIAQGQGGKIINIASMLSFQGGIRVPSYTASKSGVLGITRLLANEWAAHGINVNAIAPGYMATNNTQQLRDDEQRSQEILDRIPAGRWGVPEDLQGPVVFLASAASDYVNGHTLAVDGGWLAR